MISQSQSAIMNTVIILIFYLPEYHSYLFFLWITYNFSAIIEFRSECDLTFIYIERGWDHSDKIRKYFVFHL
jgi:hypothetical protein